VVDAGAKGLVRLFEGVVRLIQGDPILPGPPIDPDESYSAAALVDVAAEQDYQFCTEVLVRGEHLPPANEVRTAMHTFGGSVQVAIAGDVLKIHVHTDSPEDVFAHAARWGTVAARKADDMRAQHQRLRHGTQRAVAIVTDSSADLTDAILDRHHIAMVPLQVVFGDEVHLDRVGLRPEAFYHRLRDSRELPTTSQPTPGDFVRVFRSAGAEAEAVVAVLLSGGLSGTYQAGVTAARVAGLENVSVVDSRTV
jgi:hypothetical protein